MAGAVSGLLPLEDKATAMRIPSWSGKPLAAQSGPAVSMLIRKVSGMRRYRLPMIAMTNTGPQAGTRALHISACVRSRRALSPAAFRVMAHGAVDGDPLGSRERRWSRGLPEATVAKKVGDGGMVVDSRLKGRGSERPRP